MVLIKAVVSTSLVRVTICASLNSIRTAIRPSFLKFVKQFWGFRLKMNGGKERSLSNPLPHKPYWCC